MIEPGQTRVGGGFDPRRIRVRKGIPSGSLLGFDRGRPSGVGEGWILASARRWIRYRSDSWEISRMSRSAP